MTTKPSRIIALLLKHEARYFKKGATMNQDVVGTAAEKYQPQDKEHEEKKPEHKEKEEPHKKDEEAPTKEHEEPTHQR